MEKKTYGIEGLVDWKAQLSAGKAKVIVHFSGGALTRYGVTPAEFSTADPMLQHVIENSDHYKSGKIKLLRVVEVSHSQEPVKRVESYSRVNPPQKKEEVRIEKPKPAEEQGEDSAGVAKVEEVEVSCLQDALDYLREHFGLPSVQLRSYEKVYATGLEHNVKFTGGKFKELTGK